MREVQTTPLEFHRIKKNDMKKGLTDKTLLPLLRNLTDAGCDEEMIKKFVRFQDEGKRSEQLRLLSQQKKNLLHVVHENQKRVDCLDYLIYSIRMSKESTVLRGEP